MHDSTHASAVQTRADAGAANIRKPTGGGGGAETSKEDGKKRSLTSRDVRGVRVRAESRALSGAKRTDFCKLEIVIDDDEEESDDEKAGREKFESESSESRAEVG